MVIKISEGIAYRIIEGEALICNIPSGSVLILNRTASYIFNLIGKNKCREEIVKSYSQDYECSEDEAMEDVKEFLEELKTKKIVDF